MTSTNFLKSRKKSKRKYLSTMAKFKVYLKTLEMKLAKNFKKTVRESKITRPFAESITIGQIVTKQNT
jgi:hypothetical protein